MVFSKRLISAAVPPTWARMLGLNAEDNITATGTVQADAYQLTQSINRITGGAALTGVRLPSFSADITNICAVRNPGPNRLIYPNTGEEINGLGANNPITVGVQGVIFFRVSDTRWITI